MKPTGTIKDIALGSSISFIPAAFIEYKSDINFDSRMKNHKVTGIIIYINAEHRFFRVAYEVNGYKLGQSFKF